MIDAESIQVNGKMFTWKKQIHTHLIYERLDRSIARKDWSSIYPNAYELHGNFTCSDHCHIILVTSPQPEKRKAFPFRFQNFWQNCEDFNSMATDNWRTQFSGTNMFKFTKKLKTITQVAKDWSKKRFGNTHDNLTKNAEKIDYVEQLFLIPVASDFVRS